MDTQFQQSFVDCNDKILITSYFVPFMSHILEE